MEKNFIVTGFEGSHGALIGMPYRQLPSQSKRIPPLLPIKSVEFIFSGKAISKGTSGQFSWKKGTPTNTFQGLGAILKKGVCVAQMHLF